MAHVFRELTQHGFGVRHFELFPRYQISVKMRVFCDQLKEGSLRNWRRGSRRKRSRNCIEIIKLLVDKIAPQNVMENNIVGRLTRYPRAWCGIASGLRHQPFLQLLTNYLTCDVVSRDFAVE